MRGLLLCVLLVASELGGGHALCPPSSSSSSSAAASAAAGSLFIPRAVEGLERSALRTPAKTAAGIESMVQSLAARQFVTLPDFLVPEDRDDLFMDLEQRYCSNEMREGGIKGSASGMDGTVRKTLVRWLDRSFPSSKVESQLLEYLDVLRAQLGAALSLELCSEDTEAMFVRYPAGGFYSAHSDSHSPSPEIRAIDTERRLSFLLYLNVDAWQPDQEGCLRLWPGLAQTVDLPPLPGSLILFNSRDLYHEVLKTAVVRRAVVGWFRVRDKGAVGAGAGANAGAGVRAG